MSTTDLLLIAVFVSILISIALNIYQNKKNNNNSEILSKNDLSDVEEKLTKIINFVDQLQSIDTDEIEPMAHPLNQSQRLRADKVVEENNRDKIQKNTKSTERGMYIVPKVIE